MVMFYLGSERRDGFQAGLIPISALAGACTAALTGCSGSED